MSSSNTSPSSTHVRSVPHGVEVRARLLRWSKGVVGGEEQEAEVLFALAAMPSNFSFTSLDNDWLSVSPMASPRGMTRTRRGSMSSMTSNHSSASGSSGGARYESSSPKPSPKTTTPNSGGLLSALFKHSPRFNRKSPGSSPSQQQVGLQSSISNISSPPSPLLRIPSDPASAAASPIPSPTSTPRGSVNSGRNGVIAPLRTVVFHRTGLTQVIRRRMIKETMVEKELISVAPEQVEVFQPPNDDDRVVYESMLKDPDLAVFLANQRILKISDGSRILLGFDSEASATAAQEAWRAGQKQWVQGRHIALTSVREAVARTKQSWKGEDEVELKNALEQLWHAVRLAMGDEWSVGGNLQVAETPPPVDDAWMKIGFQSDTPAEDLRAMGLLSLDWLAAAATHAPNTVQSALSHTGTDAEYPFATVAINLTALVLSICGVNRRRPGVNAESIGIGFLSALHDPSGPAVMMECMMTLFELLWTETGAQIDNFSEVLSQLKARVGSILTCDSRPTSLDELRDMFGPAVFTGGPPVVVEAELAELM